MDTASIDLHPWSAFPINQSLSMLKHAKVWLSPLSILSKVLEIWNHSDRVDTASVDLQPWSAFPINLSLSTLKQAKVRLSPLSILSKVREIWNHSDGVDTASIDLQPWSAFPINLSLKGKSTLKSNFSYHIDHVKWWRFPKGSMLKFWIFTEFSRF